MKYDFSEFVTLLVTAPSPCLRPFPNSQLSLCPYSLAHPSADSNVGFNRFIFTTWVCSSRQSLWTNRGHTTERLITPAVLSNTLLLTVAGKEKEKETKARE